MPVTCFRHNSWGQEVAKRALEVAAAGGHNALLSGSPGDGKTLLARALPGILPDLTLGEALEAMRIYSVADTILRAARDADDPVAPVPRAAPYDQPRGTGRRWPGFVSHSQ